MTPETRIELAGVGPVACIAMAWRDGTAARDGRGELRVTVMVKAAFSLVHDGTAALRGGAPIAPGDRHYEGSAQRSVEIPGDLAPRKARADIVVVGHAHAPSGAPSTASSARLGVFRDRVLIDKTLHVFGDRTRTATTPQPFARMPVVYERSHGGPSSAENPVGVGLEGSAALPNILDPKDPKKPVGFGPIAAVWPVRTSRLGAEDQRALTEPIPELRADFPWSFFQCAPEDQQTDLLRGDEGLLLDGFHPTLPRVQTRLPQVRAKARVHRRKHHAWDDGAPLVLACDTCMIDADHMIARLTFRGDFAAGVEESDLWNLRVVAGIEMAGVPVGRAIDPQDAAPMSTPAPSVAQPPSGPVSVRASEPQAEPSRQASEAMPTRVSTVAAPELQKIFDKPVVPFQKPVPGVVSIASMPDSRPRAPAPNKGATLPVDSDLGPRLDRALGAATPFEKAASRPARAPMIESPLHGPTAALTAAEKEAILKRAATPWGNPQAAKPADSGVNLAGLPFAQRESHAVVASPPMAPPAMSPSVMSPPVMSAPPVMAPPAMVAAPPMSAPAVVAAPAMISAPPPDMAPPALSGPPSSARPISSPGPVSPHAALPTPTPKDETGIRAELLSRLAAGTSLKGLSLAKADLSDLDLSGAALNGVDLRGAKLSRANLSGAKLEGANLSGAQGDGALFDRAKCEGANLSKGRWERASFAQASMKGADFSGATLTGADLSDADLSDAKLSDAKLSEATFDRCKLARARADGAQLVKASLVDIDAPDMVLDRATLEGARMSGAKLQGASFAGVTAERTSFVGADLTGAKLGRATLDGADFSRAKLEGADLRQAKAVGARFDEARMARVQGARADLSESRFTSADLTDAVLRPSRLVKADFSGAKLDGADLRDADLRTANLSRASRNGTKTTGAKMVDVLE